MEVKFEVVYQLEGLLRNGMVHAESLEDARDIARMEAQKIGASAAYLQIEPESIEVLNS